MPREPQPLTDREVAILDFEKQQWRWQGMKEDAIRKQFGISATRYWQIVNALLDRPEAYVHNPTLVKRLRRLREARQRARRTTWRRVG